MPRCLHDPLGLKGSAIRADRMQVFKDLLVGDSAVRQKGTDTLKRDRNLGRQSWNRRTRHRTTPQSIETTIPPANPFYPNIGLSERANQGRRSQTEPPVPAGSSARSFWLDDRRSPRLFRSRAGCDVLSKARSEPASAFHPGVGATIRNTPLRGLVISVCVRRSRARIVARVCGDAGESNSRLVRWCSPRPKGGQRFGGSARASASTSYVASLRATADEGGPCLEETLQSTLDLVGENDPGCLSSDGAQGMERDGQFLR